MLFKPNYKTNKLPTPRQFQTEVINKLKEISSKRICIMAPTGAGKAVLLLMIAANHLKQGKKVLLLVDRITLIDQLSNSATEAGMAHGVIQGNHHMTNSDYPFQIGSVQTILRRDIGYFDVILHDEAHTMYKGVISLINASNGLVIGCTATPFTKGIGKIYDTLIMATTAHKLTQDGILVTLKAFACKTINMHGAKTIAGEWSDKEVQDRGVKIVGDVVKEYKKHAEGKHGICFCATIHHAEETAKKFRENDIPAAVFCATTTPEERKCILHAYDKGEILILCSVSALSKGFDKTYIEVVLDCRPLRKSLGEYIQMVGRGLRIHPGKEKCILLDFSGNLRRFIDDFEDVYFNGIDSLDNGEKRERPRLEKKKDKKDKTCSICGFTPVFRTCLGCGNKLSPKQSIINSLNDAELEEVKLGNGLKVANNKGELWIMACNAAMTSHPHKRYARARFIYRDFTGHMPPFNIAFHNDESVKPTTAFNNFLKSKTIAWVKSKDKLINQLDNLFSKPREAVK